MISLQLKAKHAKWSEAIVPAPTCRSASSITLTSVVPDALSIANKREQRAHCILAAAGLEVTACNKHAHEWLHVIVSPWAASHGAADLVQT